MCHAVTVVPTVSPITTRRMLPGVIRLNTTIGSLLSMHSEIGGGVHHLQAVLQHLQIGDPLVARRVGIA